MKKRTLTDEQLAECQALKSIFMARRHDLKLTQEKAADALGMVQGSFSHYLNGRNALNLDFALRVAKLLGVPVSDFSPRLAKMLADTAATGQSAAEAEAYPDVVGRLMEKIQGNIPPALRERLEAAAAEVAQENTAVVRKAMAGDMIRIAHYDVQGAMGHGMQVPDYPEMLPDVVVSQQHLRELGVTFKDVNYLKVLTGLGQSMAPTIQHLDPMIGDVSIRQFDGDAVYAFIWQGHFYIKSLQIHDVDHFLMVSKNPLYQPKQIRIDETYIQAKILLVWNATRV